MSERFNRNKKSLAQKLNLKAISHFKARNKFWFNEINLQNEL